MLADEGVIVSDNGHETVKRDDAAVQEWGIDLLAAAEDLLRGRIAELPQTAPVQATLLGLHPHAYGTLRAPNRRPWPKSNSVLSSAPLSDWSIATDPPLR